ERHTSILLGTTEAAGVKVALEHLDLGAEHTPTVQHPGHLRGNGSEILAHDHRIVSHALEGEDAEQLVHERRHVCAVACRMAERYPEQPEEPERVIDAERAGVPEAGA